MIQEVGEHPPKDALSEICSGPRTRARLRSDGDSCLRPFPCVRGRPDTGVTEARHGSWSWGQSDTCGVDPDDFRDPCDPLVCTQEERVLVGQVPESATEPTGAGARHAHASKAPYCAYALAGIGVDSVTIRPGVTLRRATRRQLCPRDRFIVQASRSPSVSQVPLTKTVRGLPGAESANGVALLRLTRRTQRDGRNDSCRTALARAAMQCPCMAQEILFLEATSNQHRFSWQLIYSKPSYHGT